MLPSESLLNGVLPISKYHSAAEQSSVMESFEMSPPLDMPGLTPEVHFMMLSLSEPDISSVGSC